MKKHLKDVLECTLEELEVGEYGLRKKEEVVEEERTEEMKQVMEKKEVKKWSNL